MRYRDGAELRDAVGIAGRGKFRLRRRTATGQGRNKFFISHDQKLVDIFPVRTLEDHFKILHFHIAHLSGMVAQVRKKVNAQICVFDRTCDLLYNKTNLLGEIAQLCIFCQK